MFDVFSEINWIAIIVATLIYFVLGAAWFTPLFGKAYDKGTGVERSSKQRWPAIYYYGPFLSSLVVTLSTAVLLYALDIQKLSDALLLGIVVGTALASISISNAIAPNMPRPVLYGVVVGSYHLVSVCVVAVLLTTFG